jgi:hypothetical protein
MARRGFVLTIALLLAATTAQAGPQFSSGLSVGGGARWTGADAPAGVFVPGLRADLLLGRRGPQDFGLGPFVSVRFDGCAQVAPALGVSLLLPVHDTLPLVLSAGAVADLTAPGGPRLGAVERLSWGSRSYNYESVYGLSVGLWIESRQFPGASRTVDLVAGVDVDLEFFVIPFLALSTWLRH